MAVSARPAAGRRRRARASPACWYSWRVCAISSAKPSRAGSSAAAMHCLAAPSAVRGSAAMRSASACAACASSARGTAHCTRPSCAAVAPSTVSAPRINRLAVARPGQPRQALGAAGRGQQPEPGLGQSQPRLMGRHAQVAGQGQFEAAAQRGAADLRQRHRRRRLQPRREPLQAPDQREHPFQPGGRGDALRHQGQVGAGAEHAVRAAQVDHRHAAVGAGRVDRAFHRLDQALRRAH